MKKLGKYLAIAVSGVALVSSAFAGGVATKTLDVKTGSTSLTVSDAFLAATSEISIKKIIPGKVAINFRKQEISLKLPITGGAISTSDFLSEITHSGGFSLSNSEGDVKVSVTDFVVSVDAGAGTASVSALVTVNGSFFGRETMFSLDLTASNLSTPFEVPKNKTVVIRDAEVKLTQEGADALNAAFDVTIFDTDTVVATAKISAIVDKKPL